MSFDTVKDTEKLIEKSCFLKSIKRSFLSNFNGLSYQVVCQSILNVIFESYCFKGWGQSPESQVSEWFQNFLTKKIKFWLSQLSLCQNSFHNLIIFVYLDKFEMEIWYPFYEGFWGLDGQVDKDNVRIKKCALWKSSAKITPWVVLKK